MIPVRENRTKQKRPMLGQRWVEVDGTQERPERVMLVKLAGRTETGGQDLERDAHVPARAQEYQVVPQAAQACEVRLGPYPRQGIGWEARRRQSILGNKGQHIQLQEEDGRGRGETSPDKLWLLPGL